MDTWRVRAKCIGMDPEKFLPNERELKKERAAKKICKGCPVRMDCLGFALATDSIGIFAGTTYSERQLMMVMMPSLRPTKSDEPSHNDKTPSLVSQKTQDAGDIGYIPTLRLSPPSYEFPL